MSNVRVRAREGLTVPMERSRIQIGAEPVEVPDSHYYRRQILDGDLIVVPEIQAKRKESQS